MLPGPQKRPLVWMRTLRKKPSMAMTHATMIIAEKRWIMPALSTPPMKPIHVCAQALSLYLSGMPVSTSVEKLIMMKKCTQRWNAREAAEMGAGAHGRVRGLRRGRRRCEGGALVADAAVDASHGGTVPPSGPGRST